MDAARRRTGPIVRFLIALVLACAAHEPASSAAAGEKLASEPKLPADVVLEATVGADEAATFRHTTHFDLTGGTCTACHPEPFRMLTPAHATSHEEMNAGKSCGVCHDAKTAFGTQEEGSCATCHAGRSNP